LYLPFVVFSFKNSIFVIEMKKAFSIFLTVIFLFSAMGVTINSHYCGMKLRSVSLIEKDCCCKSEMPKGCCKNEITYVKITDQYSPASQLHIEKTDVAPAVCCFVFPSTANHLTSSIAFASHSPPPKFADRVIAFRSLLI